jgi:hypothetical protein
MKESATLLALVVCSCKCSWSIEKLVLKSCTGRRAWQQEDKVTKDARRARFVSKRLWLSSS